MDSWQGKSKGTPLGYSIFVFILKWLGVMPAYFVLYLVAGWYFVFSRSSNRHMLFYFRQILGYDKWKAWRKLYRNYYIFGQTLLDKVVMMAGIWHAFTFDFDGEEHLHQMVRNGKGGLLISAHMGNWEIAGQLLDRLDARFSVVMYDAEHEKIKDYLEQAVGKRKMNVIVVKDDISHIYAINEALRNNELVCMHGDRFLPGNKTVQTSFLGREALLPYGPFLLASAFRVPVSYVFAFKETKKHYHFFASAPTTYHHLPKPELIPTMLRDYVGQMEEKIKRYPEQWFNYYNFWL